MSQVKALLPLLAKLIEVDGDIKSLADLANEDRRSPYHLQRVFSAELGENPLRYRRRVLLQRAAASLLVSHNSILEIALDAGFDSHEGFSRAFREMFDTSPREFRKQRDMYENLVQNYQTHLEVANKTAPCVGLYRVSLNKESNNNPKGGYTMSYEVSKKTIEEAAFLCMKRQVKAEDISEALGSMLVPVFQFATAQGIPFAGPPTARYLSFGPGLITLEAGMPVVGSPSVEGEIILTSLHGGAVASTIHKGPYDQLNKGHEAIQTWMIENNEEADGAPWEVYITDPGEVPDPNEWLTEIIHPLKVG